MKLPFVASPDWWDEAECRIGHRHVSEFYPLDGDATEPLKACAVCPVRMSCLEEGLVEEWGVWGGHTAGERRRIGLLLEQGTPLTTASQTIEARRYAHGR